MALTVAPIVYIAWHQAVVDQRAEIDRVAARGLRRADAIYADAARVLDSLAAGDFVPCSRAHIERLSQLTRQSLVVQNVSFVRDGLVRCNAFGIVDRPFSAIVGDPSPSARIGLRLNWIGTIPGGGRVMIMHRDGNAVLVDQRQFFDGPLWHEAPRNFTIRTPDGVTLIPNRADAVAQEPPSSDDMIAEARSDNWVVSTHARRVSIGQSLEARSAILVPLSVVLALLYAGISCVLVRRTLSPQAELARAVRDREFIVHYQPVIELTTLRCVGAEALLRWPRRNGEVMRPDLFIQLAEDTGLILAMTDQVVASVIRDAGDLLRRDRALHVSINISAKDVSSGRIIDVLEQALNGTNIEPDQIWLESTERGFMEVKAARASLSELRRRGHRILIDDFGTGYSSLQYLERLPLDTLKIDKSFIESVGTGAATSLVTSHIIAMARALKLSLVAEGIETEAQATFLRDHGVPFGQGWLYARAMPPDEFIAYLERNRRDFGAIQAGYAEALC